MRRLLEIDVLCNGLGRILLERAIGILLEESFDARRQFSLLTAFERMLAIDVLKSLCRACRIFGLNCSENFAKPCRPFHPCNTRRVTPLFLIPIPRGKAFDEQNILNIAFAMEEKINFKNKITDWWIK